jgi:hypothetical protein
MPRLYRALLKLSHRSGDKRRDKPPAKLDGGSSQQNRECNRYGQIT